MKKLILLIMEKILLQFQLISKKNYFQNKLLWINIKEKIHLALTTIKIFLYLIILMNLRNQKEKVFIFKAQIALIFKIDLIIQKEDKENKFLIKSFNYQIILIILLISLERKAKNK